MTILALGIASCKADIALLRSRQGDLGPDYPVPPPPLPDDFNYPKDEDNLIQNSIQQSVIPGPSVSQQVAAATNDNSDTFRSATSQQGSYYFDNSGSPVQVQQLQQVLQAPEQTLTLPIKPQQSFTSPQPGYVVPSKPQSATPVRPQPPQVKPQVSRVSQVTPQQSRPQAVAQTRPQVQNSSPIRQQVPQTRPQVAQPLRVTSPQQGRKSGYNYNAPTNPLVLPGEGPASVPSQPYRSVSANRPTNYNSQSQQQPSYNTQNQYQVSRQSYQPQYQSQAYQQAGVSRTHQQPAVSYSQITNGRGNYARTAQTSNEPETIVTKTFYFFA